MARGRRLGTAISHLRNQDRMKRFGLISLAVLASAGLARAQGDEDFIDQLAPFLTASTFRDQVRARVSGLVDLEGYYVQRPPPGLIETRHDLLFNPRLTLFLDGQIGSSIYGFAQARLDRGFDPQEGGANVRLDEYALRFGFDHGRFNVQVGQFGTIVGNWVLRHDSWENPFVTAPFPYENLTGIWDIAAPGATETLFAWAHVNGHDNGDYSDKHLRLPIVWGPSYASGAAVFGWLGQFGYAAEIKNASLSSRPETWSVTETGLQHPTVSLRLGFRPNVKWHFGFSASEGPYLQPAAAPSLPAGRSVGDYRELVLGQDISFAWRHLQIWAECYEARFQEPRLVTRTHSADMLKLNINSHPDCSVRYAGTSSSTRPSPTPKATMNRGAMMRSASILRWAIASPRIFSSSSNTAPGMKN